MVSIIVVGSGGSLESDLPDSDSVFGINSGADSDARIDSNSVVDFDSGADSDSGTDDSSTASAC